MSIICTALFSQKKVDRALILDSKTGEYINHTITEEIYEKKLKVRENLYEWDTYKNRWAYVEYNDFEYAGDTLRVETHYSFYAPDSVWHPILRTEFSYRNDTVFEYIFRYNSYPGKIRDWDIFRRAHSLIREDGKKAWRKVDSWNPDEKEFEPHESTEFEYNSEGLLHKKCVTSFTHNCGMEAHAEDSHHDHSEELFFMEYIYDQKGNLKESVFVDTAHRKINIEKYKHLQK